MINNTVLLKKVELFEFDNTRPLKGEMSAEYEIDKRCLIIRLKQENRPRAVMDISIDELRNLIKVAEHYSKS
jgi:hypothetical protein